MAVKKRKYTKRGIKERPSKLNVWFRYYLDETNYQTFLNKTESSRAAGYKTKNEMSLANIGYQNFKKLEDTIKIWFDDVGLSENALKIKMLQLMDAKKTEFFQKDGIVTDQREVEAIETQRKMLDTALKVQGMFERDNKQKGNIEITVTREGIE